MFWMIFFFQTVGVCLHMHYRLFLKVSYAQQGYGTNSNIVRYYYNLK